MELTIIPLPCKEWFNVFIHVLLLEHLMNHFPLHHETFQLNSGMTLFGIKGSQSSAGMMDAIWVRQPNQI